MLKMLTFTGSIFVLETNIYTKYVIQMYNTILWCRYEYDVNEFYEVT